jgi:glycogen debranching enzyme
MSVRRRTGCVQFVSGGRQQSTVARALRLQCCWSADLMSLVINRDTTFLISDELGDISDGTELGLYVDDTRVLSRYALTLDHRQPLLLAARAIEPASALHVLTNPALAKAARGSLSIVRRRHIDDGLTEDLEITNYGRETAQFSLDLDVQPDSAHIIAVRQRLKRAAGARPSSASVPRASRGKRRLRFEHHGTEPSHQLVVDLCQPTETPDGRWLFGLRLAPREGWHLCIRFMTQGMAERGCGAEACRRQRAGRVDRARRRRTALVDVAPRVETDSSVLRRAYQRSVDDLAALRIKGEATTEGEVVIAAGIPWFMALFGRDSLIAAYQALPFYPELAKGVLRALARLQGQRVDPVRCEEPGKILHEHRPGAVDGAQGLIPGFPYFGTIDATPLFLMVLAAVCRVTGDLEFVRSLRDNALRALEWLDRYGDGDGDGYLEYTPTGGAGLANHGWKDSADSVQFRDGTLARPPIALCEVQGYAFAARIGMAEVFEALGETDRAARLRAAAVTLRERFERDFWLPDRAYYALALDGEKRPVDAVTSNPGHLLWTGIASQDRARQVARWLLSPELFSGWGVRTLATSEQGYNPLSYHNGSVWPHDTGLIVAGLARYGFVEEAARLTEGLLAALEHAPDHRLPEVFAGFDRVEAPFPVDHPMSSRPQAWSAGSILLLLSAMAGIDPSVHNLKGTCFLPANVTRLSIKALWVGGRQVAVRAVRSPEGARCEDSLIPAGVVPPGSAPAGPVERASRDS